jgi:hypothetical protein
MQEPTRPGFGESRRRWDRMSEQVSIRPAGVLATACRQRGPGATREVPAVIAGANKAIRCCGFSGVRQGAHAVHRDRELQRFHRRKLVQKGLGKARVAVARKLGIRLWIMLRDAIDYNEFCRRGQMQQRSSDACAGMPGTRYGANRHRPTD